MTPLFTLEDRERIVKVIRKLSSEYDDWRKSYTCVALGNTIRAELSERSELDLYEIQIIVLNVYTLQIGARKDMGGFKDISTDEWHSYNMGLRASIRAKKLSELADYIEKH